VAALSCTEFDRKVNEIIRRDKSAGLDLGVGMGVDCSGVEWSGVAMEKA